VEEGFEFLLSLKDEMSGAASDAAKHMAELTEAVKKNAESSKELIESNKKLGESFAEAGKGAKEGHEHVKGFFSNIAEQVALGEMLHEGIKKLGEGLVEGVKFAIEASEFRENMENAYGVIHGGVEMGKHTFEEIDELAKGIHMPVAKAHEVAMSLMQAGLTNQENLKATITTISDLQRAGMAQGADKIKAVIERSEAEGHFKLDARKLVGTGVSMDELLKELQKVPKHVHETTKQIAEELKKGKIPVDEGIEALNKSIQEGMVGKIADQKYDMQDAFTDIKNTITGVFQSADAKPITDALKGIADSLKPGTEGAKQMKEGLDDIMKVIGLLIEVAPKLASAFKTAFDAVSGAAESVADWFYGNSKEMDDAIKKQTDEETAREKAAFAQHPEWNNARNKKEYEKGEAWLKGEEGHVPGYKRPLPYDPAAAGQGKPKEMEILGLQVGQGLADGMKAKQDAVRLQGLALGAAAVSGAKTGADSHSPSRKMMELGYDMYEGMIIGLKDAAADAVGEKKPLHLFSGGLSLGGMHFSIKLEPNKYMYLSPEREEELRNKITKMVESALINQLEKGALEEGL
jgi:hypothetical protein